MPMHHAIIPCLRYRDAQAAIGFLCNAFGFERQTVYADDKDTSIVHHAQLLLRGQMVMLGSDRPGCERPLPLEDRRRSRWHHHVRLRGGR